MKKILVCFHTAFPRHGKVQASLLCSSGLRKRFAFAQLFLAMAKFKQACFCSSGLRKRFALLALCCANVVTATSQQTKDYYSGKTVSGDKYTYTVNVLKTSLTIKNVDNIEFVTIDGERRYIPWEFGTLIKLNNPYVVIEAIETVFSKEEILEMAKACVEFRKNNNNYDSKYYFFYGFDPDVDKNGKIVNLKISFYNCDVMRNIPPQKIEQLEDYIKNNAIYTVKDKEWLNRLQIIGAQPLEVDVTDTDYSFKLLYDTNKY